MSLALHSSLLDRMGIAHAFFTRQGGVSQPPWDSLNFSWATGDDPRAVQENLRRAAEHLGVAPRHIYYLKQVHGTAHRLLDRAASSHELMSQPGDITVSQTPAVACAVRTADCPAVLLADPRSGAVAAVHSGWKGTVLGAVRAGVEVLRQLAGPRAELCAAIGPHIESCCFEVSEEVAAELQAASPRPTEPIIDHTHRKPHVSLRRILEAQLLAEGLDAARIDHVAGCTMCDETRFFSYRRDGPRGGRMLAAVVAGKAQR